MAIETHNDVRAWEYDISTRQSVHAYTKYIPFRVAAATTAADLITVGSGEIATNWITNPRVGGTDVTMFTVTGSAARTKSEAQQKVGTSSLFVNPGDAASEEGVYWESPKLPFSTLPQTITAQCEHLEHSDDGTSIKLEIRDAAGAALSPAASTTVALADSFTRSTVQHVVPPRTASASYRFYIVTATKHDTSFYLDKLMFEVRNDSQISTYVDGEMGIDFEWDGTRNASTSRKRPGLTVVKGIHIRNESSTSNQIVHIAFDCTATATTLALATRSTTGIPIFATNNSTTGGTFTTTWPLHVTKNISFISENSTPTVSGVVWGITQY